MKIKVTKTTQKAEIIAFLDSEQLFNDIIQPIVEYIKKGDSFYLLKFDKQNYFELYTLRNKRLFNFIAKYLNVNIVYWIGGCNKMPDIIGIELNDTGEKYIKKVRYLHGQNREITEIAKIG